MTVAHHDLGIVTRTKTETLDITAQVMHTDITLAIRDGKLGLGRWQGIYVAEFDGPRRRHATVTLIGDESG